MRDFPHREGDDGTDTLQAPDAGAASEDFLYHLYRGSDMLMQDRVVEAKSELERALSLQPQDAKSQDLLAGVYFRLGVYPRAIEIWERLVSAYPRNPTLRVNLGLALFKTGQSETALEHLHAALRLQPDHDRAWGYLGLVQWRLGHVEDAREAFLRGGQATMARRMEEALESTTGAVQAPAGKDEEQQAAMRSAAEEALEEIDREERSPWVTPAGEAERPSGQWNAVELGRERVPRAHRSSRSLPAAAPPGLATLLGSWNVALPEGPPLALGPAGELYVSTQGEVFSRLDGLKAVRGELRTAVVNRRARGKEIDETFGGEHPIFRCSGPVSVVLAPQTEGRFQALSLEQNDVLFVREQILWAFDDRVSFESGQLPLAGKPVSLTQLYGTGTVVLRVQHTPKALAVEQGQEARVDPASLIGWSGRLLPNAHRGTSPYSATAPRLAFRGEGYVLIQ